MYKLSESVEKSKIESTWTKLWLFEGGGPNQAFHGQKSIGSIIHSERPFALDLVFGPEDVHLASRP